MRQKRTFRATLCQEFWSLPLASPNSSTYGYAWIPSLPRSPSMAANKSVQATAGSLAVWMFAGVFMLWGSRAVPDLYRWARKPSSSTSALSQAPFAGFRASPGYLWCGSPVAARCRRIQPAPGGVGSRLGTSRSVLLLGAWPFPHLRDAARRANQ